MILPLTAQPVPIAADSDGVLRVARSRITLETVVRSYQQGATAEEIAARYPVLALADVYAVIAFYLGHRAEVDDYLAEQQRAAEQVRRENEERHDPTGVRQRLLDRRPPC